MSYPEHGERRLYEKGCRCALCTAANTSYTRALRARTGIKRTKAQRAAEKRYDKTAKGKARYRRLDLKRAGLPFVAVRVNKLKDD
jgi:phosphoserine phosphatase